MVVSKKRNSRYETFGPKRLLYTAIGVTAAAGKIGGPRAYIKQVFAPADFTHTVRKN